jgi:glutamyl-tRNA reductase
MSRPGVGGEAACRSPHEVRPIVEAMRKRASEIAREEIERTMKRIGADPEVEEHLAAMAEALVARLLNPPSARLRQAGADGRGGERLISAAVEMFGLTVEEPDPGEAARVRVSG